MCATYVLPPTNTQRAQRSCAVGVFPAGIPETSCTRRYLSDVVGCAHRWEGSTTCTAQTACGERGAAWKSSRPADRGTTRIHQPWWFIPVADLPQPPSVHRMVFCTTTSIAQDGIHRHKQNTHLFLQPVNEYQQLKQPVSAVGIHLQHRITTTLESKRKCTTCTAVFLGRWNTLVRCCGTWTCKSP